MSRGRDAATLAKKMGFPVEQIHKRFQLLKDAVTDTTVADPNTALVNRFNQLCLQYDQMGNSLKLLGAMLGQQASPSEILSAFKDTKEDSTVELFKRFIILKPMAQEEAEELAKTVGQS